MVKMRDLDFVYNAPGTLSLSVADLYTGYSNYTETALHARGVYWGTAIVTFLEAWVLSGWLALDQWPCSV